MTEAITNSLDLWSSSLLSATGAGRGGSEKLQAYGVKKLRELVLDLAVRGKLVSQDPQDEPASELLKRAAIDRATMVKEGKVRRGNDFPTISEAEVPFELPAGWMWARVIDVGHDWGQKTPATDFTYIDVSAIDNDRGAIGTPSVLSASDAPSRARKIVKSGSVIYSTVRPYLKNICVVERDYTPEPIASTAFAVVHPFQDMPGALFAHFLRSPMFVKYVESVQTGIAYPAINDSQFYGGVVPVPPLGEQHRIVAKIDELMALCDQLEQQQTRSIEAHQTLVEHLLRGLMRASSPQKVNEDWARIAGNFDTLFTTEFSIDQLKQTIMQLAVTGRLADQSANDESAEVFYDKRLTLPQGYRRSNKQAIKGVSPVALERLPPIPKSWVYRSVDQLYQTNHILDYADGNHGSLYPRKEDFGPDGVLFLTAAQIGENGHIAWDDCPRLAPAKARQLTKGWSKEGDVYFTHNATVGRTAIAMSCPETDFLLGTSVTFYRINENAIHPKYLYLYFSSPSWYSQAAAVMQQTTRDQVSITKQALFYVALPPVPEQQRIVDVMDGAVTLLEQLRNAIREVQTTQIQLTDAVVAQAVA